MYSCDSNLSFIDFEISGPQTCSPFYQNRPVDDTLQRTFQLVQEHESTLRSIERAVGDVTEALPDEYYQPISVNLCPQERVLALELLNTGKEEKFFKKVLAVFAYLCDEIRELNEIAEGTFYAKVIMFGTPKCGDDDESMIPGRGEEQMGRMLPFLQVKLNTHSMNRLIKTVA
jgi:hypothetical protein